MTQLNFDGIVAARGDVTIAATVVVVQDFERPVGSDYTVSVELDGQEFVGVSSDAFWALVKAREQYEPLGWRVAVQGASVRCFPSGMQGSAGALALYRFAQSGDAQPEAVPTFASAPLDEIVTVAEQKTAQRARIEALGRRP